MFLSSIFSGVLRVIYNSLIWGIASFIIPQGILKHLPLLSSSLSYPSPSLLKKFLLTAKL